MSSGSRASSKIVALPARVPPTARVLKGRFELRRRIGAGAAGSVYEAYDRAQDTLCALKILNAPSGDPLARFRREFRALQSVRHPNVVSFGELFFDGDEWFFTMELVAGVDFRSYVRAESAFDEERVRDSIRQLAEALAELHAAGVVHRDVKPANVCIAGGGRVALLDFGVVKESRSGEARFDDPNEVSFVGTPAYMAPEQIAGDARPASDCYAVGAMLFEAMVGRLPYMGKVSDVLAAKQREAPAAAIAIDPSLPRDLSDLAAELLAIDPSLRPSAAEIAQRVGRARASLSSAPPPDDSPVFFGRRAELDALMQAYGRAARGRATAVLIEGESGIGKSALVRRFADELRARSPEALVLAGRCRENEWVPYKAFEGLFEALSRHLRTLGDVEAAMLLPSHAELLAQVFPSLMQVAPISLARASRPSGADADVVRTRQRLFNAVKELFARVAARRPLVLFIDDLGWADDDSLALLRDVLRGVDAPPLLLVVTARELSDKARAALRPAETIALGPLADREARDLARALSSRPSAPFEAAPASLDVTRVARASEGHPLFIHELVRYAGRAHAEVRDLDAAIQARVASLAPEARELLEQVALSAKPLPRAVLVRSTKLAGQDAYRHVNLLSRTYLTRVSGPSADRIEPYHDRIREAVLRGMTPAQKLKRHRRLAAALESLGGDAEALAYHWREADRPDRAAPFAERAAEEAARAFAFDEAARLYTMAIALRPAGSRPGSERPILLAKLASALANSGRSAEAAEAYREAAAHVPRGEAITYLQKTADQLLRAGLVQEGLALAYRLLGELGVKAPRAPFVALFSFIVWRFWLSVRGPSFRARAPSELPARTLTTIDTAWSLTSGLSTIDPIRGAYFQMRHLRMALRAGEPVRVARALALQIGYGMAPGATPFAEKLARRCQALSVLVGDPHAIALTQMSFGIARYLQGRFREALELLDDAETRLRACPGTWGETARARRFALSSLASLGRMRELRARLSADLRDAREHGDLHAQTSLRIGQPNLVWLMDDDVKGARRSIDGAMRDWRLPGFQLEHHYALLAATNVELYAGEPARAWARLDEAWPRLEQSYLLRIPAIRVLAQAARARVLIALYKDEPWRGAKLLDEAVTLAQKIARAPLPFAPATAALLVAGASAARGLRGRAAESLEAAERSFEALDMMLAAATAKRRRGEWLGGDAGDALVREADDAMARESIARPERFAAMLVP